MQYGIMAEEACRGVFQRINDRFQCDNCHKERINFSGKDKKKNNSYSNLLPGFSSESMKLPVDLLIIAEAHGGGREEDFREQGDLEKEIANLAEYYLDKRLKKFHQQQIRYLLDYLNGNKIRWIFTDLIKCFVWRGHDKKNNVEGSDNVRIAINNCRIYLNEQIQVLRPKKVLALGKTVAVEYLGLPKKLNHGSNYEPDPIANHKFPVIYSIFPSQFTADLWVEHGGWEKIFNSMNALG